MEIFIAGATGVLGRRVTRLLAAAGHNVIAVARDDRGRREVVAAGGHAVTVDLFDREAVVSAVAGADVVANLATNIPTGTRALLSSAWETTHRLRREASSHLVDGALATRAGRYVQESLAFMYADAGDRWLDEDAPLDPHPIQAAAVDAEAQAARFTAAGGAGVALRFGFFYGHDAAHTLDEIALARRGLSAQIGDASAYRPTIHLDDAAAAVVAALEAPAGVYNIVDDEPLTRREHADALADALGTGPLHLPPSVVGRFGKMHVLARSHRVSNTRMRETTGWAPRYPSAREGWAAVVRDARETSAGV